MAASPTPARSAATDDLGFPRESPNCPGPQPRAARGPRSLRRGGPWKNLSVTAGPQPRPPGPSPGWGAGQGSSHSPTSSPGGRDLLAVPPTEPPPGPATVSPVWATCAWLPLGPGTSWGFPHSPSPGKQWVGLLGQQASRPPPACLCHQLAPDRQTDRRVSVCSPHASHPGRGLDRSCFLPTPRPRHDDFCFFL